jgi:hypothetical protein
MRAIQFATADALASLYESHGMRGTFNVEVMQQLAHLEYGRQHPDLARLAAEWEAAVRSLLSRGHGIELHVHTQWLGAHYANGRWQLGNRWSILDFTAPEARDMIERSKTYLESVLRAVDPGYRTTTFRSGTWALAPSDHLLSILVELGIQVDISMVKGLVYDLDMVKLDYREVEQGFLPYYPNLRDARKVAASSQPIVCVPTYSLPVGRGLTALRVAELPLRRALRIFSPTLYARLLKKPSDTEVASNGYSTQASAQRWGVNRFAYAIRGIRGEAIRIGDLSGLSYLDMRVIMRDIRRKARASGWDVVPVVLSNHTKDLGDLTPIRAFCRYVQSCPDVSVITAATLAQNIAHARYPVCTAN